MSLKMGSKNQDEGRFLLIVSSISFTETGVENKTAIQ